MLQTKTFHSNYGTINYAEGPPSGPPVVLLHGITDCWQCFMPLIPMLLPRWHVFALDFRGHGASAHTCQDYTLTAYTEDVATFLDQRVDAPAAVYGHSLGGMVGIMTAAQHPELVRGLIVGDSLLYRESVDAFVRDNGVQLKEWRDLLDQDLTVAELARQFQRTRPDHAAPRNLLMARTNTLVDSTVLDMVISGRLQDYDCARLFPAIMCPVLLLQSQVMSRADVDRALQDLRDGYATSFPDMGHGLHMEPNGTQVTLAVQLFLEGLE